MSRRVTVMVGASISIGVVIVLASIALISAKSPLSILSASNTPSASPTSIPPVPALVVRQRQVYDTTGKRIILVGVSHSSLEYSCKGDGHFQRADFRAMRAWGMTVVRIPLWSRFWLNIGGVCPGYQQTVAAAVANAEAEHLYVILDLQWIYPLPQPSYVDASGNQLYQYPLPDVGESAQFWQQVAAHYKNDHHVVFDLYGEPNSITWHTWYAGGSITTPNGTYQAIGMRALVDVVRRVAPENLIIVSGANWGYDLSQVGTTYPFPEKNLLFGTHPFDYGNKQPSDFDRAFGQASTKVAVIATEFGDYTCSTGYVFNAISYFNAHHIPWLAWTWGPYGCSSPSLLSNWNGTPSQPYGAFIQQAMLALHATTP